MIRASTGSPALERSRQWAAAWRVGANVPRRCTAMTASHSAGSMLTSMRSRRIPALLMSTSMRPKLSIARWTIAPAASKSDTSPPSTTASPPAATISSTTSCAGLASAPSPLTSPPRSLTTTLAPWRASDSACSRPIPRPAPVTTATRPSRSSGMARRLADRPRARLRAMSTQTSAVTGVDFVAVPVTDYDASAEFYGETLGLPFVKRWGKFPAGEFQAGNLTLALVQPDAFGQEFRQSSSWVALQVDDVAATRADLESKGIAFRDNTMDSGVCHMAFFADPDGNTLILHHRYAAKEEVPPAAA